MTTPAFKVLAVVLMLFFFVLSSLPISASALTMLDPGGSAVNPIYVEVVEDPWQSMLQKSSGAQESLNQVSSRPVSNVSGCSSTYKAIQTYKSQMSYMDLGNPSTAQQAKQYLEYLYARHDMCVSNIQSTYTGVPSCTLNATYINGSCQCNAGYTANGNVCITISKVDIYSAPIKPTLTIDQKCKNNYGPNSYGTGANDCYCSTGYQWASDKKSCVVVPIKSNQQVCQEYYGAGSVWSGKLTDIGGPTCDCASGFEWSSARNFCNVAAVKTGGGSGGGGSGSIVAPVVQQKSATGCDKGQQRIKDGSCVSYQRACFLDLGSQAVWTGKTNKTGDAICECAKWYQVSSDGKSCVSETKNETSQINSNTGTATSGKSWWAGFMQWLGL